MPLYRFSFPGGSDGKSAYNVGDPGSIPGWGRSPREENGYPLQYSCLENSMDCIVHGVTKSQKKRYVLCISQSGEIWLKSKQISSLCECSWFLRLTYYHSLLPKLSHVSVFGRFKLFLWEKDHKLTILKSSFFDLWKSSCREKRRVRASARS